MVKLCLKQRCLCQLEKFFTVFYVFCFANFCDFLNVKQCDFIEERSNMPLSNVHQRDILDLEKCTSLSLTLKIPFTSRT